jgi:hypothetical protein
MTAMTRVLLSAALALSLPALAAPKKGAIGSSKEDDPCPELPAANTADVAYVRALAFAFEPAPQEVRAQAIEDLGFLGDTRALNHLAVLSLDPNPLLSRAAIRAVASMRHPRAEEILGNLVRHPTVPSGIRQYALSLLPFQNTMTALRQVHLFATLGGTTEVSFLARSMAAQLRTFTAEEAASGVVPAAPVLPPPPPPGPPRVPLGQGDAK